ncbi:MAG: MBL fold metallo-hydrolase, partial [Giesbergeria sp.]
MTNHSSVLPPEVTVFERGWLSSNNVLFVGEHSGSALVDTGYCTHSAQTLALVQSALGGRPLERILNTHLHSDHCGSNAALQQAWPQVHTAIPPGQAAHVRDWDPFALSYTPTGQECPQFRCDALLQPGTEELLGDRPWQVHAAPGHDPHSIVLFEPQDRILISADALWESGFGVVFPELDGADAFDEVARTLDLIEHLAPRTVIPGHGPVFHDAPRALG